MYANVNAYGCMCKRIPTRLMNVYFNISVNVCVYTHILTCACARMYTECLITQADNF